MKGMFEEFTWTALIFIVVLVISVITLIAVLFLTGMGAKPLSFSINFVDISNRPYVLAGITTHFMAGDRNVLEHSIEAAVAGSLSGSGSENLKADLKALMEKYRESNAIKYYAVKLKKGNDVVMGFDSQPGICGNNGEGICVTKPDDRMTYCGVGRISVDEGPSKCPSGSECCSKRDVDEKTYQQKSGTQYRIVRCGKADNGICSYQAVTFCGANPCRKDYCGEGRKDIKDTGDVCKIVNNGSTLTCCATIQPEVMRALGYASTSTIPLFYKNEYAELEVTIGG